MVYYYKFCNKYLLLAWYERKRVGLRKEEAKFPHAKPAEEFHCVFFMQPVVRRIMMENSNDGDKHSGADDLCALFCLFGILISGRALK